MDDDSARSHFCYALINDRGATYVGYTVDPARRLRQHNGQLVGGARRTSRCRDGSWRFLFIITLDASWTARRALSLEWHLKWHGRNRHCRRYYRRCTYPALSGEALRIDRLRSALVHPKFEDLRPNWIVLVRDASVDTVWAALVDLPGPPCCVLPLPAAWAQDAA